MALRDEDANEFADLVQASHLAVPDDVPSLLVGHAAALGADAAALYLVDYEQRVLVPLPKPGGPEREAVAVDTTLAGRCYRTLDIQQTTDETGGRRIWVPVLDGVERLGVLELVFTTVDPDLEEVAAFAGLIAEVASAPTVDLRHRPVGHQRRARAGLRPGPRLLRIRGRRHDRPYRGVRRHGHGLEAGLLASVAVAACRNTRRCGGDLADTVTAIDQAINAQFGPERFVTAVLADLDLATGRLQWVVCGHPPPLLLRKGRIVKTLARDIGLPLGLGGGVAVAEETLEPPTGCCSSPTPWSRPNLTTASPLSRWRGGRLGRRR